MASSSTPARWPLFGILSQWASVCTPQGERDIPGQGGEEAQFIRAHLRRSPADLRWLAGRGPGSADLLPHMLEATGIDAARLPTGTHDALAARCGNCSDKPHCAQELARNKAADSYAAFCPNAEAIRTLRGD